ncbi:TetR/AcrR family transcriptional regulator [Arsenophonus nasoniae]|nr:TetR/AcrR family transcriptional regulator [Arsenophonus nasoniae]QBY45192.1 HTH-type transcriptional repressor AcnR [Arsenophonus nasoniae]WGM01197.1 TetR/AcrR family transcriptional regulator [Arsenophonus nasoniae]WGM05381.1 TetR/AcrR family transcriptional regulator [Arsenophonus nasoniae]WGM10389.1 TetR/AcrR family transcriptional regulator [Arsenophonus nasoniae]WGM15101.1 TetR/AcrR family transcriptional regulator [Arsenophonus nasoniae]
MADQTEKQRAKKKQIITAAIHCFVQKGFHATSTAEICKAAGMSPGNLFHYYPTKNAIIEAIALQDQADLAMLLQIEQTNGSAIETVITMMTRLLQLYNEPTYARLSLEIIAEASRNPVINSTFIENEKIVRQQLVDVLKHGVSNSEIDPKLSIENTASWLMTIADGAIGRDLMEPEFDLANRLESFIYMIKKILMPIK